jgi:hypothetical protein
MKTPNDPERDEPKVGQSLDPIISVEMLEFLNGAEQQEFVCNDHRNGNNKANLIIE